VPISGQLTNAISITNSSTTATAGTRSEALNLGGSPVSITDGNGDNQFSKIASGTLTLLTSTPQELDLTAVVAAFGTVTFSTVKYIRITNASTTSAHKTTVGGASSNAFDGPFAGTAPTVDVYASGVLVIYRPLGTGWTVDSTHKALKFNPGSNAQTVSYVIAGT
jgi:Tfp pilus assembly protein FimT